MLYSYKSNETTFVSRSQSDRSNNKTLSC